MNIILFGPPGAGKGTQAALLQEAFDLEHFSTGNAFRNAISNETPLGKKVKSILDAGELVPDDIVVALVQEELSADKYKKGTILDGFPRTVAQAEALHTMLKNMGRKLDAFLSIEVPEEELIKRIISREEGRSDDTPEKLKTRLEVYERETRPVEEYYNSKGMAVRIKGTGTIDEIFGRIKKALPTETL